MKIIRVTQWSLNNKNIPTRRLKLQLTPDLLLEASPTNYLKVDKQRGRISRWFLPERFPQSVHGNYLGFSGWTGVQGITTSLLGGNCVVVVYKIMIFIYKSFR